MRGVERGGLAQDYVPEPLRMFFEMLPTVGVATTGPVAGVSQVDPPPPPPPPPPLAASVRGASQEDVGTSPLVYIAAVLVLLAIGLFATRKYRTTQLHTKIELGEQDSIYGADDAL